jgi:uncharacterized repeat protein (TIGR01451 family)
VAITVPSGLQYTSASGASCSASGGTITCALGALLTGTSLPFTVTVAVAPGLTGAVSTTASISSPTPDSTAGNNTATDPTTVVVRADLVTSLAHVGAFVAGATGTYTLAVTNNGSSTATGVVLTLDVPSSLSFGTPQAGCSVGGGKLNCTVGTLAPGATVSFTVSVQIASNASGPLTSTANATSSSTDPSTANNKTTDTVTVALGADLEVTLTHVGTLTAGSAGTYTITIRNTGPSPAPGVGATLILPSGVTFTSANGAKCSASGPVVTCALTGTLDAGSSALITVKVAVGPAVLGAVTSTVTVTTSANDPNPTNDTASETTTVVASADLKVAMTHKGWFRAGTQGSYSLTISNGGPSTATDVVVTITLPAGMTFVSAGSTCSALGAVVTCTLGTLAPGATVSLTLIVAVASGISGTFTPVATVTSPTPDPNSANNSVSSPTTVKR